MMYVDEVDSYKYYRFARSHEFYSMTRSLLLALSSQRAGKGASVTDIHIQCIAVIRENIQGKEEPSNDKHDQGILNFQINDGVGSYSGEDTEEEICVSMLADVAGYNGDMHVMAYSFSSSMSNRKRCRSLLINSFIFPVELSTSIMYSMITLHSLKTLSVSGSKRIVVNGHLI